MRPSGRLKAALGDSLGHKRGGITLSTIEEMESAFLATPSSEGLVALYQALKTDLKELRLASILDQIRPIQHRVTWIQADATAQLLHALARDPHRHVRKVVASHSAIDDEVCFRLSEDQQTEVRLALRKNPKCHPVIRVALLAIEKRNTTLAELLTELCWQAKRADMTAAELMTLISDWTGLDEESLLQATVEQTNLVLDVLNAKLGKGKMPRKPRKKAKKKAKKKR
jgi:hypothetical protein